MQLKILIIFPIFRWLNAMPFSPPLRWKEVSVIYTKLVVITDTTTIVRMYHKRDNQGSATLIQIFNSRICSNIKYCHFCHTYFSIVFISRNPLPPPTMFCVFFLFLSCSYRPVKSYIANRSVNSCHFSLNLK